MSDYRFSPGDRIHWSGKDWTVIDTLYREDRQAYRITEDVTTDSVVLVPYRAKIDTHAELVQANEPDA